MEQLFDVSKIYCSFITPKNTDCKFTCTNPFKIKKKKKKKKKKTPVVHTSMKTFDTCAIDQRGVKAQVVPYCDKSMKY